MRAHRLHQAFPFVGVITIIMVLFAPYGYATDAEVLRPRVPIDQIEEARSWTNPYPATEDHIEKGKALFHGKAFCLTCHGRDGRGLADVEGLRGKLPRNFTDKVWQAARMDGELFWILKNGSPGTDMASFVPLVLTEEEAWHVVLYVRSFGRP
jgi:mono/diheme cytochrome c family protein